MRVWLVCVVAAWFAAPSGAAAYSDADYFSLPPSGAGAGGRYFTRSPIDGYSCGVCHQGPAGPVIRVFGLPVSGYKPGTDYEITVDWSDDLGHLSASLEVTDMEGKRAGRIRLPRGAEILDAERCDGQPDLGSELIRVPPRDQADDRSYCGDLSQPAPSSCREIVHVNPCGSRRARFLWTAPAWDLGKLWFAGSAVASDNDTTTQGDGVTDFVHEVASASTQDAPAITIQPGCSAAPGRDANAAWTWLGMLGILGRRRRRRGTS